MKLKAKLSMVLFATKMSTPLPHKPERDLGPRARPWKP